jgi:hypothetical protein
MKLTIIINQLTLIVENDIRTPFIDEAVLQQVIAMESSKTFLTKKVDDENICDYEMDICDNNFTIPEKFDLIISQATLEHLYNPFQSMVNKFNNLNKDGILVLHTHPPNMPYHSFPRDYFRYMEDWWIDLPKYIDNIRLIELYTHDNYHVFALYQKI